NGQRRVAPPLRLSGSSRSSLMRGSGAGEFYDAGPAGRDPAPAGSETQRPASAGIGSGDVVTRVAEEPQTADRTARLPSSSRPASGSSRSRRTGSAASARATATRRRSPPARAVAARLAYAVAPSRSSHSAARRRV